MKKFVSLLLTVVMFATMLTVFAVPASAEETYAAQGLCGSDGEVHWALSEDLETLTIWGHGNMKNYAKDTAPWYEYNAYNTVKHLKVGIKETDSITRIGSYAFAYFYYLEDIKLGEGVEFIEDYAFYEAGYKSESPKINLEIPSTVFYIGQEAFSNALGLKSVNIKSDCSAFREFAKKNTFLTLSGDKISADGLYIQKKAFYECTNLDFLSMEMGVKNIGEYAFGYAYGLKNVIIKSNNVNIGNEAFYCCNNMEQLSIGTPMIDNMTNGITESAVKKISMGEYAFGYCENLERIFFSNAMASFGYCSFYGCNKINRVSYSGMEDDFKKIEKLGNNYNDSLKDGVSILYLNDLYRFSLDGDYYIVKASNTYNVLYSPLNDSYRLFEARYPFKSEKEYDEEGYWYTYPSGEKSTKVKFDHWEYDDSKCWRVLPNGEKAFEKILEWEATPNYHYHTLPDGQIIHRGPHTESGKCELCGFEGGFAQIQYINEKGETANIPDGCTTLSTDITTLNDGWYIVDSELDYKGTRLEINGNVKIILLDNCGITTSSGIHVCGGSTLNVYSESLEEHDGFKPGYIRVNGAPEQCAGIGNNWREGSSTVNFYGGNISSWGGEHAAGIGSADSSNFTVNIYNGYVEGHSKNSGAGIGSGMFGNATITIYGGIVKGWGGDDSAGIGGGYQGSATVTIHAGTVEGWGGIHGSGIGFGKNEWFSGNSATVTVKISDNANVTGHGNGAGDITNTAPYTSSVLSEGNIWIIAGIGVAAVVVLAVIVAKKKKKPALAEGTDNTNEE